MNASVPRPNANATTVTYTHRSGDSMSKATFGSTLARADRSCRTNQTTSTTPTAIATAVAMPDTMLTETACHAGHLDAARELLDGSQWLVLTEQPSGLAMS